MIKILLKALILVCIILSIYFIVNPSACSNLMSGKVVNSREELPTFVPKEQNHSELLTPKGDQPLRQEQQPAEDRATEQPENTEGVGANVQTEAAEQQPEQTATPVTDTNSLQTPAPAEQKPGYSVAEMDYAIANRYVELENEYIKQKKDMKKAAQEISYIVMDDFEMTPSEWEAFLQRATVDNLFEKVRAEQAAKK
ncbi:MAG: hypothetical protein J6Y17_01170 [Elusimicrobiaceae bacterium]|nr:hypothetical protein [Elusimicrobiaceae bacterium]